MVILKFYCTDNHLSTNILMLSQISLGLAFLKANFIFKVLVENVWKYAKTSRNTQTEGIWVEARTWNCYIYKCTVWKKIN